MHRTVSLLLLLVTGCGLYLDVGPARQSPGDGGVAADFDGGSKLDAGIDPSDARVADSAPVPGDASVERDASRADTGMPDPTDEDAGVVSACPAGTPVRGPTSVVDTSCDVDRVALPCGHPRTEEAYFVIESDEDVDLEATSLSALPMVIARLEDDCATVRECGEVIRVLAGERTIIVVEMVGEEKETRCGAFELHVTARP